mmetsp:Transcript_75618/g.219600  ORF Transcript_75618/g.219600 Transcript_75618/m.219600 type:complete len:275 (-) Transcript_75618:414-1238(-)
MYDEVCSCCMDRMDLFARNGFPGKPAEVKLQESLPRNDSPRDGEEQRGDTLPPISSETLFIDKRKSRQLRARSAPSLTTLEKSGGDIARSSSKFHKRMFISLIISAIGRSLISSPKGCSNSIAMPFKLHETSTEQNVKATAHKSSSVAMTAIMGVSKVCAHIRNAISCRYGVGNGNSAIFCTSFAPTSPRESSWKTRVKIGGGTGMTPLLMFCTTNLRTHCKITSHLSSACERKQRLSSSNPVMSITSSSSSGITDICCNAEQYIKLIRRTIWF